MFPSRHRLRLRTGISLLLLSLAFSACHKKQPVVVTPVVTPPPPPAPPVYAVTLETANREFAVADYAGAARDFERFLQMLPSGESREFVLFRLGLIYSLPIPELQDWSKAQGFLRQLASEFPSGPWRPVGQFILSLKEQTATLTSEIDSMKTEAVQIQAQIENLRATSSQQTAQITKFKTDVDQLTAEIEKRDQRIKQLNDDLQRLIRIDSRPQTPSRK